MNSCVADDQVAHTQYNTVFGNTTDAGEIIHTASEWLLSLQKTLYILRQNELYWKCSPVPFRIVSTKIFHKLNNDTIDEISSLMRKICTISSRLGISRISESVFPAQVVWNAPRTNAEADALLCCSLRVLSEDFLPDFIAAFSRINIWMYIFISIEHSGNCQILLETRIYKNMMNFLLLLLFYCHFFWLGCLMVLIIYVIYTRLNDCLRFMYFCFSF